jgi:hypothetical protein
MGMCPSTPLLEDLSKNVKKLLTHGAWKGIFFALTIERERRKS